LHVFNSLASGNTFATHQVVFLPLYFMTFSVTHAYFYISCWLLVISMWGVPCGWLHMVMCSQPQLPCLRSPCNSKWLSCVLLGTWLVRNV